MSLPDKCPFCGAGVRAVKDGDQRWVEFECFSEIGEKSGEFRYRSPICRHAELNAAKDRVAEMEAENKHLTQLLEAYRVHADTHRALLDKYDAERNGWLDIVGKASRAIDLFAKLEARCKLLELAGDNLDLSIACGCGVGGPCQMCRRASDSWKQSKEAKP